MLRTLIPILLVTAGSATALNAEDAPVATAELAQQAVTILENNCFKCHGPEKQKGELRLDSAADFAKGGEHGPIINADKPNESPILKGVRRDPSLEEDYHMPPKIKDRLSEDDIAILAKWVAAGAPWPE